MAELDDYLDLARRGVTVAALVGERYGGQVRQLAQAVVELAMLADDNDLHDDAPDRCQRCGQPIQQPPTGRRRKYCSDRCRKRRNAT